jgi:hypothetical protein
MKLDEQTGFAIAAAGVLIAAIGALWLLVRGFRQSVWWGLALLLVPLSPLVFLIVHFRKAIGPFLVMILGGLIGATPLMINIISGDRIVTDAMIETKPGTTGDAGETLITLTGAKPEEYAKLTANTKNLAVVQWANPDVHDGNIANLEGLNALRELDLNGTQLSDVGLKTLAKLPKLQSLRIARTKITDAGFKELLLPLETLDELDLTGTAVTAATAREWKNKKPGRKLVR